jgi:hypothetical protein
MQLPVDVDVAGREADGVRIEKGAVGILQEADADARSRAPPATACRARRSTVARLAEVSSGTASNWTTALRKSVIGQSKRRSGRHVVGGAV